MRQHPAPRRSISTNWNARPWPPRCACTPAISATQRRPSASRARRSTGGWKNMGFNLRVSLHVAGILATLLLLAWCVSNTRYYATMTVLSLLLVAQVAGLLRMLHSTNRELERFMQALHYMDFTQRFQGKS